MHFGLIYLLKIKVALCIMQVCFCPEKHLNRDLNINPELIFVKVFLLCSQHPSPVVTGFHRPSPNKCPIGTNKGFDIIKNCRLLALYVPQGYISMPC